MDDVAANTLLASSDHLAKTMPPPATLLRGMAVSMETSQTSMLVSAPEQLMRRSPLGDQPTSVTGECPDL